MLGSDTGKHLEKRPGHISIMLISSPLVQFTLTFWESYIDAKRGTWGRIKNIANGEVSNDQPTQNG